MTLAETTQRYKYHLLGVAALVLYGYGSIIYKMALQWYQDENYSHGFLVPLIAGYFLYERREALKNTPVSSWGPGLAVIIIGLLQLILGFLATEFFTMRSSLIVLLAGMVLYLFGKEVFKKSFLPIGYLIMMVPLPYIVYDLAAFPLKLFVTRVSVDFLHLIGIVVLREGNIIIFPATTLEVADACSGMRSLMSLLALAIAFAFFMHVRPLKRFLLIVSAIPVAILTNSARVIVTGVLARFWGAQVAEGFFHEFAGFMAFALAIAILAGIGVLLGEAEHEPDKPIAVFPLQPKSSLNRRFIVVFVLLAIAGSFNTFHTDLLVPLNRPFTNFPTTVHNWRMVSQDTFNSQILDVLKPTDYLSRTYTDRDGTTVQLYIGYHGGGSGGGEIHSPKHCLPGSGWQELSSSRTGIDVENGRVNLVKAVYKLDERAERFYYWFQVRDRTLSDEYSLKLAEVTNSLLHRRRDASFIRITVPVEKNADQSQVTAERFIKDFTPVIREFLPR